MEMKADPSYADYLRRWTGIIERCDYVEGLAGYFLVKSHKWSERHFGPETHFGRVLEVGAGTGIHIRFVRHSFDEYRITDLNPPALDRIVAQVVNGAKGRIVVSKEDATSLSFPDGHFDRVIAAHVLEHLYRPHEVLREWARVTKPGGVVTLILPCDPGVVYRLGRHAFARRNLIKEGIDYDYWMAREHVNPLNALIAFVRFYFQDVREEWQPLRIPSMDLNLFYIAHIRV
jgi:phosphatidylethanolamine/phosphatidyl-N-methylethanolamine N-methyltransferase